MTILESVITCPACGVQMCLPRSIRLPLYRWKAEKVWEHASFAVSRLFAFVELGRPALESVGTYYLVSASG